MWGRRSQHDFQDEIQAHIELETERLKAQGMSEADASLAARRRFGNIGVAQDRFYHGRRFVTIDDTVRDVRHALRGLLRTPTFLATTTITLALAIGAVAGMFDVVNTVLLRPLPYPGADRLVSIQGTAPGSDLPEQFGLGPEFYLHYKENSKLLEGIAAVPGGTSTLRVGDRVERVPMAWPTNGIYATLGVRPQLGRLPRDEDGDDAVVLSDRLWATWFGRDPSVIGKWYFVSDSMKQVIGVMPPEFRFPSDETLLWVANEARAADIQPGNFGGLIIGRLKPGVTSEQLTAELKQLAGEIPARFSAPPEYSRTIQQFRPVITPLLDAMLGPAVKTSLLILLGAVAVVLLIACANVANLFLVRAETRRRDLTVRRAIGATRTQLVRYQMTEAFVVALIAGVLAVGLASIALPVFVRSAPQGVPRLGDVHIDLATIAAAFALVVIVALACGAAPAIRGSAPDLAGLRAGGRGYVGGRQRGRDILVVAQTALALVLLIGSALLSQSFRRLRNVDAGYDIKNVYTFQYAPDQPNLRDGPSLGNLHLTMMDRFRALPGVTAVGVVNNLPLDEGTNSLRVKADGASDGEGVLIDMNFTGGDYFQAMGIRLLQGRNFTNAEAVTPNNSIVISKSAAEKLWPGQNPIGHNLRPDFGEMDTIAFTVVGVVNDVKQDNWRDAGEAVMYFPLTGPSADFWGMGSPAYVLKSTRAEPPANEIRRLIREVAPEAPVYREYTMEFLAQRSLVQLSFTTLTLGVLSALALLLGAVGLYGTLSYVVAQQTRAIGVRMALGATARAVRTQIVAEGTKIVLLGAVIGVIGAFGVTRFLAGLLFDVKPADPVAFGATSALLLAVGALASYMPARRASNVDPMVALRMD
jgi:putative ABC transport system permease protein